MTSENKSRFLLAALTTLLLLPFVNRAVFVDDHAHVQVAQSLMNHPLEPYRRMGSGMIWQETGNPMDANPPLHSYLVGGFMKIFGPELWKVHLFMIPFHILSILAFFEIAKRYTKYAFWASVLWMTTPHFWLTSNSLLVDSLITPFLLTGMWLWMSGWDENKYGRLLMAGVFLGLACLVKYTAVMGIGFVFLWSFLEGGDRKTGKWAALLTPLIVFGGWIAWTKILYHQSHFGAVAESSMVKPSLTHILIYLVFFIGTSPILLLGILSLRKISFRSRVLAALLIVAGGAAILPLKLPNFIAWQLGFWLFASLLWIFSLGASIDIFKSDKNKFLFLWVATGSVGLLIARGWFCARYFVILGPGAILLTLAVLERKNSDWLSQKKFRMGVVVFFMTASGLLAIADAQQAGVDRQAAAWLNQEAKADTQTRNHYYPSAMLSGLNYYLDQNYWSETEPGKSIESGAVLVMPWQSLPKTFYPHVDRPKIGLKKEFFLTLPLRTLDGRSGAGFYGSIWGPLPFSFSRGPAEVYTLIESE